METTRIKTSLGPNSTLKDCLELLEEHADEPFVVQFVGSSDEYLGVSSTVRLLADRSPDTKANSIKIGYAAGPGARTSGSILSFAATRRNNMAHIDDIRKTLRELTDEELDEVIRGKRKLRREAATKARTKKKAATPKKQKKSHAASALEQLKALPPEARLEILKALGESK